MNWFFENPTEKATASGDQQVPPEGTVPIHWRVVNDDVMGGRSKGTLDALAATSLLSMWQGQLVLEGGGFSMLQGDMRPRWRAFDDSIGVPIPFNLTDQERVVTVVLVREWGYDVAARVSLVPYKKQVLPPANAVAYLRNSAFYPYWRGTFFPTVGHINDVSKVLRVQFVLSDSSEEPFKFLVTKYWN